MGNLAHGGFTSAEACRSNYTRQFTNFKIFITMAEPYPPKLVEVITLDNSPILK